MRGLGLYFSWFTSQVLSHRLSCIQSIRTRTVYNGHISLGIRSTGQALLQLELFKLNVDVRSLGFFQPVNQLGLVTKGGFWGHQGILFSLVSLGLLSCGAMPKPGTQLIWTLSVEDVRSFPCEFRLVSLSTYFYPQWGRLLKSLRVCAIHTVSLGTLAVCLPRLFNFTAIYSWIPLYGFLALYSMLQCDQSYLPPVLFKSNLQMET